MFPTGEGFIFYLSISKESKLKTRIAVTLRNFRDRSHALLRAGERPRDPAVGIAIFRTAP